MKRKLRVPALNRDALDALSGRAQYEPYAKHKRHPRAFGLEPISEISDDPTYCDEHAGFTPDDMARIPGLMCRGIAAGLTSKAESGGNPRLLWSIDDNGWVYEARLTNEGQALYHGYPLLPGDPVANKVISRYRDWAYGRDDIQAATKIADAAQERYGR